jgi:hypothetical protein
MIERSELLNEVIPMKCLPRLLITFLLPLFAFCLSYASAETKVPDLSKLPGVAKTLQITGEVKAVDVTSNSITVVKKMKEKTVAVTVIIDSTTVIEKDKQRKTFADITKGNMVVTTYTSRDGKNIAKSISIKPTVRKSLPESKKEDGGYKYQKRGAGNEQ